jgi:hypothetical protein
MGRMASLEDGENAGGRRNGEDGEFNEFAELSEDVTKICHFKGN